MSSRAGAPGPAPLRRLTRFEYDNTVFDLLGDKSKLAASFPEEPRMLGFDNNARAQDITLALGEDYMEAAEALAARAAWNVAVVPACASTQAAGETTCARDFIVTFGQRAYRRPLTDEDVTGFLSLYSAARALGDHRTGLRLLIASFLQSPYFLYRPEFGDPAAPTYDKRALALAPWETASRLSYFLWGTMPDNDLFAAARANMLRTPDHLAVQARRMMNDARAQRVVANFHEQWMQLWKMDSLEKDAKRFPGFPAVRGFMKEETARFLDDAFWGGEGSAANLLTSPASFMNPELAAFLKITNANQLKPGFQMVTLDPMQRAGLLTQASLLSAQSRPNATSPSLRASAIFERLLCADVPPPHLLSPTEQTPVLAEGQTTRGWVTQQTAQPVCLACHGMLDAVGFALENFDPVGRWRALENNQDIDASGKLSGTDADGPFSGVVDLAKRMSGSSQMRSCIATQWFRYALGRAETPQDKYSRDQLNRAFEASHHSLRALPVALTQMDSFLYMPAGGGMP